MAISFVVGDREFFRRWFTAPGAEHLRDIVLMSGRPRDGKPAEPGVGRQQRLES
jgi:hypothetical protein